MSDLKLKETGRNRFLTDEIYGIRLPLYLALLIPAILCLYLNILPINIITGLMITMGLGGLFLWIGDSIPKFSEFGGGTLLCIFFTCGAHICWGLARINVRDCSKFL